MKEQGGGGSIINTSSMVGTYNIRVNAVAPGVVGTDMVAESVTEQMLAGLKAMPPLGRMADPKELAGVYVYLASDEASFTTGTIVHVDGGIVM